MKKDERINEIETTGMIEEVLEQLSECQTQLDNIQKEIVRISNNIDATICTIEKAHAKLVTGGQA